MNEKDYDDPDFLFSKILKLERIIKARDHTIAFLNRELDKKDGEIPRLNRERAVCQDDVKALLNCTDELEDIYREEVEEEEENEKEEK